MNGNKNYVHGRAREYHAMRTLSKLGALDVKRSYGSHGLFDIYAVFPDHVSLIQVKSSKYIRPGELAGLKDFAAKITSRAISVELWQYQGRGRPVLMTHLSACASDLRKVQI